MVEILLNSFKMPHSSIRDSILAVNDQLMTLDIINRILALLPNQEIMELIIGFEGPATDMGTSEQFLLCLSSIPSLSARLSCMAFRHHFYQEIIEIDPDTKTCISAANEVKKSKYLRRILQIILVMGNYLNGTSFRGNAQGFKIGSLLVLQDTKTNAGPPIATSLHHLIRILEKEAPDAIQILLEMPHVEMASRISISSLIDGFKELATGFEGVLNKVKDYPSSTHSNDRFLELFTNFCEKTAPKISLLQSNISTLNSAMNEMFGLFAEDSMEKQEDPQWIFQTLTKFSNGMKKAKKDIDAFEAKLKRQQH